MKESYVTFETAKLLKEKGFDWDTDKVYVRNLMACRYEDYPMPTQATACRWLREEKGIFVDIRVYSGLPVQFGYDISVLYPDKTLVDKGGTFGFSSYEEATEKGLKYVLQNLSKYL